MHPNAENLISLLHVFDGETTRMQNGICVKLTSHIVYMWVHMCG